MTMTAARSCAEYHKPFLKLLISSSWLADLTFQHPLTHGFMAGRLRLRIMTRGWQAVGAVGKSRPGWRP
ncbi:hypothetical protein DDE05_48770, partial [Streptomyces cavourensis]